MLDHNADGGPTLKQLWFNVTCLVGSQSPKRIQPIPNKELQNITEIHKKNKCYIDEYKIDMTKIFYILMFMNVCYVGLAALIVTQLRRSHTLKNRLLAITELRKSCIAFNPYPAKLIYFNFHPLEVVSRYRDPQLQVDENNWYLFNPYTAAYNLQMCGFPLSNIWHIFSSKKTSDEQLILKAIYYKIRQLAIIKAQIKRPQNESEKK